MKVLIINSELKQRHIDLIKDTAQKIKADICFVNSEDEIGDDFKDAFLHLMPRQGSSFSQLVPKAKQPII